MVLGLPSLCGPQPRGFRRRGREAQRTIASAVRPLDNAQVGLWGPEGHGWVSTNVYLWGRILWRPHI